MQFRSALWLALVATCMLCAAAQTTHNITQPFLDDFICNGNATVGTGTGLAGDMTALENLRSWCAADSRCAELYAQDGAPNLDTFIYLFQTTLTVPVGSVFLETPLYQLLCNKTGEEFLMAGWVLLLNNQMLDAGVCDVNERFVLNESGTGGTCVCQPGKVCESDNNTLVIAIIILVAVIVALAIQFGVVLWNNQRLGPGPRIAGAPRPSPEAMVMGSSISSAAAAAAAGAYPQPFASSGARYRAGLAQKSRRGHGSSSSSSSKRPM